MCNLGQYDEVCAPHNKCTAVKRAVIPKKKYVIWDRARVCLLSAWRYVYKTELSSESSQRRRAECGKEGRKEQRSGDMFHLRDSLGPGRRGECGILHMRR